MMRVLLSALLAPLAVPLMLVLLSAAGSENAWLHFEPIVRQFLPYSYGLTILVGLPILYALRRRWGTKREWLRTAGVGFGVGFVFIHVLAGGMLGGLPIEVYLLYGAAGLVTALCAHAIAFGSFRSSPGTTLPRDT